MVGLNMQIEWKTRLCQVGEKLGYFHTWEHYSKPLEASPMIGGAPAGVFSKMFGIVEFFRWSETSRSVRNRLL